MELLIIICPILIAVFVLVFTISAHLKKSKQRKYYVAAGNILREDYLNYSLQNPMYANSDFSEPNCRKTMIYLKSKSSGKKLQFVFDPEKKILIGRDKYKSNIYINDVFVSQNHCCIFSKNDRVYLQDLNAVNGTFVKRGLIKKYRIFDGYKIMLKSGDRIIIGANKFKVILFYFDMSFV